MAKRRATKQDDLIDKLTPQQALEIIRRLSEKGGKIAESVRPEARNLLQSVDLDDTADEVFFALDSIDVQDCWDRSGKYTEPSEAAVELVEVELQPFYDQAKRFRDVNLPNKNWLTAWE